MSAGFYATIIAALRNTLDALTDANTIDDKVVVQLELARDHLDAALAMLERA